MELSVLKHIRFSHRLPDKNIRLFYSSCFSTCKILSMLGLPLVLNIRKVMRTKIYFVAHLFPALLAPVPGCFDCFPKSLEVIWLYWSFCHDYSPYYILFFTFLLGYIYTILSVSQNNSYYRYTVFWNGENWVKVSINPLTKANKPPIMTI